MDSLESMLLIWCRSASVMHISHHEAASRYSKWNLLFGSAVSGLSALVASSVFVAALEKDGNKTVFIIAAIVSLITAILVGINTSLNLAGRSEAHHQAATNFQGLRREIEEELVRCSNCTSKESYRHIRERWSEALKAAPPLPKDIHKKVKIELDSKYGE